VGKLVSIFYALYFLKCYNQKMEKKNKNTIYKETRPWGFFTQFTHNKKSTVKILHIKKNSMLSLQFHKKREEFWYVLEGQGYVIIEDKKIKAIPGKTFTVNKKSKHRIITEDFELKILEISTGNFDENDIVRLEDKYNRIDK